MIENPCTHRLACPISNPFATNPRVTVQKEFFCFWVLLCFFFFNIYSSYLFYIKYNKQK